MVLLALAHQQFTTITPTYAVSTPSGGWHLYYTTPPGSCCATPSTRSVGRSTPARMADTSSHPQPAPPSGYELFDDRDPTVLPYWLHQALTPTPSPGLSTPAVSATTNPDSYVAAALRGEAHRVRTAPPGQHNAVLCRAAYALGQLVGAGLLD